MCSYVIDKILVKFQTLKDNNNTRNQISNLTKQNQTKSMRSLEMFLTVLNISECKDAGMMENKRGL